MSSILKALRRAEEQSPKSDIAADLLKKVDTKKVVSRRAKGSRAGRRIMTSAIVVIVLGLGLWFTLHFKALPPGRVSDDRPQASRVEQVPAPGAPKADKSSEPVKSVEATKEKPALPAVESAVAQKQDAEVPRPARKEAPAPQQQAKSQEGNPEDSRFKLEAIVWSENLQSRFAVINGQILRTGGSIEGLTVLAIEKDFISVRTSGRDWTMKFTVD